MHDEAASWFERAIDMAQAQGALWWELRATVCLCRLWNSQGRQREAQERLQLVYAKFSDGFSTMDLSEAAALRAELRH